MSLPKISETVFNLVLPSTGKKVTFRPWTVGDEKSFLIARQTQDKEIMLDTTLEILSKCLYNKIDVHSLSSFDIEYIMLQVRARSVSEIMIGRVKCKICDKEDNYAKIQVNISEIEVKTEKEHEKTFVIGKTVDNEDIYIEMKYPTPAVASKINPTNPLGDIELASECVDKVYTDETVFNIDKVELQTWLQSLSRESFHKIELFFLTMPKIQHTVKYICPACKTEQEEVLSGFENFT